MTDLRCSVPGCESPSRSRGLCNMHYQRWLKDGAAGEAEPRYMPAAKRGNTQCSVEDCDLPVRSKGLCAPHYNYGIKHNACPQCGGLKTARAALCASCEFQARDATKVTEKACTGCARVLPIEAFRWRTYKHGYKRRSRCRECESAYARERGKLPETKNRRREYRRKSAKIESPEKKRLRSLRSSARKYGFDPDAVIRYWDDHGHECSICQREPEGMRLHLDHCHETGEFRGVLCSTCNTGLGMFGDDPEVMVRAIKYLKKRRPRLK